MNMRVSILCCLVVGNSFGGLLRAQDCTWQHRASGPLDARGSTAMAYDAVRQRTVLFGGSVFIGGPIPGVVTQPMGDTWEWDGQNWEQVATSGPRERAGHAMVYDSSRGVVAIFGGRFRTAAEDVRLNDLWKWDGVSWEEVHPGGATAPPARDEFGMVYDRHRNRYVVFGGLLDNRRDGEVWEWDGELWHHRTPVGARPQERHGHAMAYDTARQRTVVFGGVLFPQGRVNDTWEWDGETWNMPSPFARPTPRYRHAMTYHDGLQASVMTAGNQNNLLNDETWLWDGQLWTQLVGAGNRNRVDHALAYDSRRRVVVHFGGRPDWIASNETWELDCQLGPICYANCDDSSVPPILSVDDFVCFIDRFAGAQALPHPQQVVHYANCDGSMTKPVLNVDDFTCFINAFAQGCP